MTRQDLPSPNRAPWWRKPGAVLVAAGALALAGTSYALWTMSPTMLPRAPLTTLAGAPTSLAALAAGKPTVVNLWATWCPPCRLELPYLAAAQRQDSGINFVFVDQGEDAVTVQRYLSGAHPGLANVMLDAGSKLGREIGSSGLPITLFFDRSGRMVDTHLGALSPALLEAKLTRLRPSAP